jgi:predicted permease
MKIFRRKKFECDMDTELGFHLDAYVEDLVRSGLDRTEATRRARIEFGAIEATKDECRQAWGLQRMDELRADLRFTFRTLRQNPSFAAVAILALTLGIGANTAIFGLVDAVMLRILPLRDAGRLVFVQNVGTQGPNGGPPYPCFELLRDKAKSFEAMAAFSPSSMELVMDGGREQVRGVWVSGNFYDLLGIKPLIGRALSASDDNTVGRGRPDGPVAVISSAYWQQRFSGDPAVVGRALRMFDYSVTIVGVMPSDLMSLEPGRPIDIAVPVMLSDPATLRDRGAWWLDVVARLKPGVSMAQARAESDALFQSYMVDVRVSSDIRKLAFDRIELVAAGGGLDVLRTRFSKPLTALLILAGLVLLASCVTVANLMLARATARQREFAVRLAIGARRGRLIRQTLTEALVLVGAGSAFGIVLARQGEAALASFFAEGNDKIVLNLSLNGHLVLFAFAISLLTGIAFGLLPALRAASADPAAGLQSGSRSIAGSRRSMRLSRALVVLQVALSTVLLAGAALFIHSFRQLESVDLGFAREGILTMEIAPERTLFGKPDWLALQTEILDGVRRVPGVRSASWSTMTPLSGRDRGEILDIPGFVPRSETEKIIHLVSVSPEYFTTLGVSLVLGRAFEASDAGSAAHVAILNEAAAKFYFGSADPIGKTVRFPKVRFPAAKFARSGGDPVYTIVGVAKDAKHQNLRDQPWRFIYIPIRQAIDNIGRVALSVRCSGDAMIFAVPVRKIVQSTRSGLLITNVSTIEKQVERSLLRERLVSTLSTAFGALALVLACIGLYGILAYAVTRRTSEIGIRMALGATKSGMVWMILREAAALTIGGIAVATPAVVALGRISNTLLYGVESFDLPAFACALLVLLVFAAIAGMVPARRAGRLNPMSALRCE